MDSKQQQQGQNQDNNCCSQKQECCPQKQECCPQKQECCPQKQDCCPQKQDCCKQTQQCCQDEGQEIKKLVQQGYAEIAHQTKQENEFSVCGKGGCCTIDYAIFAQNYNQLDGYVEDANLGLGCGIPTEFAQIRKGDIVLDLGSGAGNDCFIARALCGESGKVIGVDMTPDMIRMAQINSDKHQFRNVEFRQGDIEALPLLDNFIDVVISNCVINLCPDKKKVFQEIHRVLKQGGQFSISDVLLTGDLPKEIKNASELYVGCVSGALRRDIQLEIIQECGFTDIEIKKEKVIAIPDDLLLKYVTKEQLENFKNSGVQILSATFVAKKK